MRQKEVYTADTDKLLEFSTELFKHRLLPNCKFPVGEEVRKFADEMLAVIFPHYSDKLYYSPEEIKAELTLLKGRLIRILSPVCTANTSDSEEIAGYFLSRIPEIHELLLLDAAAMEKGDPAASSIDEVIITYPGFFAVAIYRMANIFYQMDVSLLPRLLTEYANQRTGIDINPGARIGRSFCIDHGNGIVIGETSVIGDNVKIYQGVTLGALSVKKELAKQKRHPTIEDNTVIYSSATILGGRTVIGQGSVIGGNVWLTESVPPGSVVYHKSEVHVRKPGEELKEPINFVI
ncbi:MAG: serine O-acetyltransferase [Bacteroidota bacterium]